MNGVLTNYNKDIESYKVKITGIDYSRFVIKYSYISEANATVRTVISITSDGIYELPKSFASDGSLTSDNIWIGINFTKQSVDIPDIIEDVNVTIEVLPEYENGLAYDGIDDNSSNNIIPIFTDYTYIIKYKDFDNPNPNSCIQRKGNTKLGGGAFVHSYISTDNKEFQLNFGRSNGDITNSNTVQYCTKTNYNGITIIPGTNIDDLGFTIGKWNFCRKMIFYKLMLWSKSINNTYHINMLRNLIYNGGIIDLNNPIFESLTDKN